MSAELEAIEALILHDPEFRQLEGLLDPFNIFEALGVVRQEIRHSDFLAFLSNPNLNHGLGDAFVRQLLQKVLAAKPSGTFPISPIHFDLWDFDAMEVRREWQNLDLLFLDSSHRLVVILENKVWSGEHDDQLSRYWRTAELHFPDHTIVGIYLSPDGSSASDDRYISISYDVVCQVVEQLEPRASADVSLLMKHYIEMVRRNILENTEIAKLARSVYQRHQKALDLLFEYRYDRQEEIRTILSELIKDSGLTEDSSAKSAIRFCPPQWDKAPPLMEGQGWTRSHRLLLYQFNNLPKELSLGLYIGPGPEETRRRLHECALAHPEAFNVSWKQLGKQWNTIFQRAVVPPAALESQGVEQLTVAIREFWEQFTKGSLPQIDAALNSLDWLWDSSPNPTALT